jgi:hypothetical protein
VIDDSSNSNDSSLNKNNIPSNTMPSTAQTTHVQVTPSSPVPPIGKFTLTKKKEKESLCVNCSYVIMTYPLNVNLFRCCK